MLWREASCAGVRIGCIPGLPFQATLERVHRFLRFNTEKKAENHRGPQSRAMYENQRLTERIIGLAIDVHRATGPGLLESAYKTCLCWELERAGIAFEREAPLPIFYRGEVIRLGFRADIVIMDKVILEIKAVPAIVPAHDAQMLTYLRMSHIRVGLLLNFHAPRLVDGLKRFVV